MRAIVFPFSMSHRRGRPRGRSNRNDRDPCGGRAAVAFGYRATSAAGDAADPARHSADATEAVEGVAGNVFVRVGRRGGVEEREARCWSKRAASWRPCGGRRALRGSTASLRVA
jgi:hypothetical protein